MFNPTWWSRSWLNFLIARIPPPIWPRDITVDDTGSLDTSAGCSLTLHALLTGSCSVAADMVLSD